MLHAHAIEKFKHHFEKQKKDLLYTQEILDANFQVHTEDLKDEVDLTSSDLEQSMRIRLRNREALFIKKIDEALNRIRMGKFGLCQDCEEDIEFKRLEARPTTTLCLNCKEDQERREQVHADGHKHKSIGKKINLRIA
ncbi:MAG: TraR/DksA family transcriptional regulator [Bacteriovoracia bacterium]